ncbi:MAG: hypothetical protein JO290_10885 [Sphingomonadaceae bacterium]|nr:hypothetical protein [Sphingomonadaceae bacterium]
MTAVALDTLRIAKRLREAGFSEPQAEAVTGVLHDAQEVALGELATKGDLREVRSDVRDVKAELAVVKADLKSDIAGVKGEVAVLKWAVGLIVAGVIALVMKAFFLA